MTSSNWNDFSEVSTPEIETDGRNLQRASDPPTNESIYIPPGDTAKEAYRLSTYLRFPHEVPVSASDLAAAGFFFTGYKDRVKCFICAASMESWAVGDNPHDSKWHHPDCSLVKGEECGNIRIGAVHLFERRFNQPSTSPVRVGSGHSQPPELATIPSVHHEQLVRSLDLRRESKLLLIFLVAFFCGMVLAAEMNNILLPLGHRLAPSPQPAVVRPTELPESVQKQLRSDFPCLYPRNPHMRNEMSRLKTFDYRWSDTTVPATPQQIAQAGFYFLGDRNRVKCWYCNGGLQNWEPNVEPWSEHAKWFPTCEFVIQGRGPEFVAEIVRLFPNHRRPNLRNGVDVPPSGRSGAAFSPVVVIDPQPRQQGAVVNDIENQSPEFVRETVRLFPSLRSSIFGNGVDVPSSIFGNGVDVPPFGPFGAASSPVIVIDPQVEMQRNKERAAKKMNSSLVKMAEEMGFDRSAIQKSIERKLTKDNTMYQTFREIIDDLLNMSGDSDEDTEQSSMDVDSQSQPENTPQSAAAGVPSSMEERMKELEDERKCKICLDALADVVFVPCGHLCSCVRCAQSLRECPICRGKIEKAIKTYLS